MSLFGNEKRETRIGKKMTVRIGIRCLKSWKKLERRECRELIKTAAWNKSAPLLQEYKQHHYCMLQHTQKQNRQQQRQPIIIEPIKTPPNRVQIIKLN